MTAIEPTHRSQTAPERDGAVTLTSQLAELLTRASWRLRRGAVKELAPLGLTFAQSRLLRTLARAGEPLRIGDLAARQEVVPRSTTTMVDALEAAGLVSRQADPGDRRSVLVGLTTAGNTLLARMDAARRESAEALFDHLTPAQQQQLLDLLTAVNEQQNCESPEAGATP